MKISAILPYKTNAVQAKRTSTNNVKALSGDTFVRSNDEVSFKQRLRKGDARTTGILLSELENVLNPLIKAAIEEEIEKGNDYYLYNELRKQDSTRAKELFTELEPIKDNPELKKNFYKKHVDDLASFFFQSNKFIAKALYDAKKEAFYDAEKDINERLVSDEVIAEYIITNSFGDDPDVYDAILRHIQGCQFGHYSPDAYDIYCGVMSIIR